MAYTQKRTKDLEDELKSNGLPVVRVDISGCIEWDGKIGLTLEQMKAAGNITKKHNKIAGVGDDNDEQ